MYLRKVIWLSVTNFFNSTRQDKNTMHINFYLTTSYLTCYVMKKSAVSDGHCPNTYFTIVTFSNEIIYMTCNQTRQVHTNILLKPLILMFFNCVLRDWLKYLSAQCLFLWAILNWFFGVWLCLFFLSSTYKTSVKSGCTPTVVMETIRH